MIFLKKTLKNDGHNSLISLGNDIVDQDSGENLTENPLAVNRNFIATFFINKTSFQIVSNREIIISVTNSQNRSSATTKRINSTLSAVNSHMSELEQLQIILSNLQPVYQNLLALRNPLSI